MSLKNNKKAKYIIIVIMAAVLDMSLHVITSNYTVIPGNIEWSLLAQILSVPVTSAVWAFFAFGNSAYVFSRLESKMMGSKYTKGLFYGGIIGLLWLIATLAGVSTFGNKLENEFVTGLCDAIPITLMGWLLGIFTTEEAAGKEGNKKIGIQKALSSIVIFALVFSAGRYITYSTNLVRSGYQSSPSYTLFWTIFMGISIGISYLILGQAAKSPSVKLGMVKFGVSLFGMNWAVFGVFMPMLFKGFIKDFAATVVIDIVLVILSYYLTERFLLSTETK